MDPIDLDYNPNISETTRFVRTDARTYSFFDVTVDNHYVIETMKVYMHVRLPAYLGDSAYSTVLFKTVVDMRKLFDRVYTNFLSKSFMDSFRTSISGFDDFQLPLKKVSRFYFI